MNHNQIKALRAALTPGLGKAFLAGVLHHLMDMSEESNSIPDHSVFAAAYDLGAHISARDMARVVQKAEDLEFLLRTGHIRRVDLRLTECLAATGPSADALLVLSKGNWR